MKKVMGLIGLSLLLAACGADEDAMSGAGETVQPIEVEVLTPAEGDTGDWLLEAYVTQDGEPVNDASEVKFEVYVQNGKEDSDMLDYTEVDEGVYSVPYTFEDDGVYFVIPHVTARNMHNMPTHQILIGDVHAEAKDAETDENAKADGLHIETNLEEAEGDFTIEVRPMMHGEAIQDARVRLELAEPHSDSNVKVWLDTEEQESGLYVTDFQFEKTGEYEIVFHIEKDAMHEHPAETFEIE
ncbi:MAG TPA: FixH family protein [Planococcus sp. (in: firmicutes)]|nr:FixH family protein [Planococcus sp. (in: firmicutes)]